MQPCPKLYEGDGDCFVITAVGSSDNTQNQWQNNKIITRGHHGRCYKPTQLDPDHGDILDLVVNNIYRVLGGLFFGFSPQVTDCSLAEVCPLSASSYSKCD